MSIKTFPSVRDIFNQFELTNFTTAEYDRLQKEFTQKLTAAVPQFKKNDEIDCIVTGLCIEAQTTGFEQGFTYAVKLLMNGGNNV